VFLLADWLFIFNYWALSVRVELIKNNLSEDLYNKDLQAVNIVMSVIIVLVPSICGAISFYSRKISKIMLLFSEILILTFSIVILFKGLLKMAKIMQKAQDHILKK